MDIAICLGWCMDRYYYSLGSTQSQSRIRGVDSGQVEGLETLIFYIIILNFGTIIHAWRRRFGNQIGATDTTSQKGYMRLRPPVILFQYFTFKISLHLPRHRLHEHNIYLQRDDDVRTR